MNNLINKIKYNVFLRSLVTLMSGSILAQVISALASPAMTRLYNPEAIGVFTYVLTSVSIFSPIINGKYDLSIVCEENENNINAIIKLAFCIGLLISSIVTIIFFCYFYFLSAEYSKYSYSAIFILVLLIIATVQNILTYNNNRLKEYKLITSMYVIRTGAQSIIMVILGFFHFGVLGLLISQTVGQFLGMKRQAKSLQKNLHKIIKIPISDIRRIAKLHRMQPLYAAPAAFSNSLSYSSINIFIEMLFGLKVLGLYSISYRVLGLPLSLISSNVSKVYFEEAARQKDLTGEFYKVTIRTLIFMFMIALIMVIVMTFFIPPLMVVVFGSGWDVSGEYIKILAPMFGIRFITSSMSTGLIVAKKQKLDFRLQSLFVIGSLVCFLLAKIYALNVMIYLKLISCVFSFAYLVYLICIIHYSKDANNMSLN